MAKIYLVRHAESVANTKGIYQGQTYDTELSVVGKKQARALANYFTNIKVDKIFASPLLQTKETAHAVTRLKQTNIFETPELIETNHGQWEGLEKKIISDRWPNLYQLWLTRPSEVKFPEGETFLETKKRVINWWNKRVDKDENVLIVTHDNIIRIIIAEVLGLDLDNIWKFQLSPAAVTVIEVEKGNYKLLTLDEKHHLKNLLVNLSNHAL
jgi:probable phosphoglycerate mutase